MWESASVKWIPACAILALPACGGGEIQKQNETFKARLVERDAEVARLDEVKRAGEARLERLAKDIEDLQARHKAQSERLADLQGAADRLARERDAALTDLRQARGALDDLRRKLERVQGDVDELTREVDRLRLAPDRKNE